MGLKKFLIIAAAAVLALPCYSAGVVGSESHERG